MEFIRTTGYGDSSWMPKRMQYTNIDARLKTFENWNYCVPKEQLAEAGFYSRNDGDKVNCFMCGLSINMFEPGDDAWVEHAKHNPLCAFVQLTKSRQFIIESAKEFIVNLWLERIDVETILEVHAFTIEDAREVLNKKFETDLCFYDKFVDFYNDVKEHVFKKNPNIIEQNHFEKN